MGIDAVGVVIPARDEAGAIGLCLSAVVAATNEVQVPALIVVVDDASSDGTGIIARSALGAVAHEVPRVQERNVGAARRAGHQAVIEHFAGVGVSRLWLASTDADSLVPRDWLRKQLTLAEEGVDCIAGTIGLETADPVLAAEFDSDYRMKLWGVAHGHIHGANMGFRASAYLAAGGFHAQGCHEDVSLWRRLRATPGLVCRSESNLVVATSDRRVGRLTGGFASYLSGFEDRLQMPGRALAG